MTAHRVTPTTLPWIVPSDADGFPGESARTPSLMATGAAGMIVQQRRRDAPARARAYAAAQFAVAGRGPAMLAEVGMRLATSPVTWLRRALATICIALVAATAGLFAGPGQPAGAANLNCGILASYECIYLSIGGDGTGTVTFSSYTLAGVTHVVSLGACQRQGSITSGGCVLGFSYFGISATTVDVNTHVTVDPNSCFRFAGGACGAGGDEVQTFLVQPTVTDGDFAFALNAPEAMHVHLIGTGTGTVTSSPRGINCPSTCSVDFPTGASITLTETPAAGDTFGGWGQLCAGPIGGTTCSWTINSTLDINVTFSAPATPPPTPKPTPTPARTPLSTSHPTTTPKPGPTSHGATSPGATATSPTLAPAIPTDPVASGALSAEASPAIS